ncbi:MAG: hypothetical protein PVI87_02800 [Gammaproteobacteria bacterium]|jgi:hypothetical protein
MSRFSLNKFPDGPGVYALYEHDRVLAVGAAPNLRQLAEEHLFAGAGPSEALREMVGRPESITEISWWQDPAFADEHRRQAARMVAIEVLAPVRRPRFNLSQVGEAALQDPDFVKSMDQLFRGAPAGSFVPQSLDALARSVYELKEKVAELERRLAGKD